MGHCEARLRGVVFSAVHLLTKSVTYGCSMGMWKVGVGPSTMSILDQFRTFPVGAHMLKGAIIALLCAICLSASGSGDLDDVKILYGSRATKVPQASHMWIKSLFSKTQR